MKDEWDEIARVFDTEPKKAVDLAEELERSPIVKFDERRAHQCHRDSCDSAAQWDVYLHIRYGVRLKAIESLKSSVRVCESHRKAAHDFILSAHNKKRISAELAKIGRLNIDWDSAVIEFVPSGEAAWGPQQMSVLQVGRP